jgi:hypothetical protein
MKKPLINASLAICTMGGAILALIATRELFRPWFEISDRVARLLGITAAVLIILGIVSCLIAVASRPVTVAITRIMYGDVESRYVISYARRKDIVGLHELYKNAFGSDVPPIETMNSWLSRCKKSFVLVYRIRQLAGLPTTRELVGSFKLLPLTREGARAIETQRVTGTMFVAKHIARNLRETVAYYVGDVVGRGKFAKAVVMAHLNVEGAPAIKHHFLVYARPLTTDGLRVMKRYGFVQVSDGKSPPEIGRLCKLLLNGSGEPSRRTTGRRLSQLKPSKLKKISKPSARRHVKLKRR